MNREMSDPFNESKFECRAKEVYKWGNSTLWDVFVKGAKEGFREGSAVQSQRIESVLAEVERILERRCYHCDDGEDLEDCTCDLVMNRTQDSLVLLRGLRSKT